MASERAGRLVHRVVRYHERGARGIGRPIQEARDASHGSRKFFSLLLRARHAFNDESSIAPLSPFPVIRRLYVVRRHDDSRRRAERSEEKKRQESKERFHCDWCSSRGDSPLWNERDNRGSRCSLLDVIACWNNRELVTTSTEPRKTRKFDRFLSREISSLRASSTGEGGGGGGCRRMGGEIQGNPSERYFFRGWNSSVCVAVACHGYVAIEPMQILAAWLIFKTTFRSCDLDVKNGQPDVTNVRRGRIHWPREVPISLERWIRTF